MEDVIYCTICLITEVKMFRLSSDIYSTYKELIQTQSTIGTGEIHACYECAYLLQKFGEFKAKCCNAYQLLQQYSAGSFKISGELLKSIDRKQNKLESKLTTTFEQLEECNTNQSINKSNKALCMAPTQASYIGPHQIDGLNINPLENPLQIDNEQIKQEVLEDNKPNFAIENTINPIEITLEALNVNLNNDSNVNKAEEVNIVLKVENNSTFKNEKSSDSSESSSSADSDSGSDSDDSDDSVNSDADTDDDDSDTESDSDEQNSDKDSDDLRKLLAKYPPLDGISVKKEQVTISVPTKRKINNQNEENQSVVKKKKKSIPPSVVRTINEILKVNPSKFKEKAKGQRKRRECDFSIDRSLYENYATIITLTHEDAIREVLLRKESRNYKLSKYKCELCFRGYRLESTYKTHMKKHSEEEGPLKCDICQQRFSIKKQLRNHLKMCHTYKFICQLCPYVCYSADQSKTHVFSHKGKQYSCKECGEKFKFPNSVSSHQRKKHKLEVVCDLCGSVFAVQKGLNAHKKKLHKREKNELQGPVCEECNVHFSNETAWKRHLVLCTKHRVSNGCSVCGESFNDEMALRKHSLQHEKKIQVHYRKKRQSDPEFKKKVLGPCVYCTVPLITVREYKNHMLKYHPETEHAEKIRFQITNKCVCEVCGMMFKLPCFLRLHQRSHTGERPYECDKCDKKFASKHTLQAHQSHHTKVYPHKCHICGKSYGNKSSLTKHIKDTKVNSHLPHCCGKCEFNHIKYHTERPFKCTNCEKTFAYLCEMRNHVKYVHNKVPWPKRDRSKRNLMNKEKQ